MNEHIKIYKFNSEVKDEATEKHSFKKGDEKNLKKWKQSLQENGFEKSKSTKLTCDTCKKHYASSQGLRRHISSVHEGLKPLSCQSCDSTFANKRNLKRHIFAVHEGQKPLKCQSCEYTCAVKYNLDVHERKYH